MFHPFRLGRRRIYTEAIAWKLQEWKELGRKGCSKHLDTYIGKVFVLDMNPIINEILFKKIKCLQPIIGRL